MIPNIKMTYNGKNPEDFGVCVTAVTTRKPSRKFYSFDIPGRNGVLKEMLRVWDNTTVDVSFAILGESSGDVIDKCDTLMEWLTEPNGYARLELSTDPDVYRMATVSEDFEISDVLAKTGEATVSFDCKPQRFLKSGEIEIELNFTEGATPGTAWDVKADLAADAQTQVDDLNLMDQNVIFPSFTLARNAEFVYLKSPHNNYRWVYPNNHILNTGRYDICTSANDLDAGDEFHVAATTSPFLSVWDEQGEIYTPSYFGTVINNPTKYPAVPIIKVYLDQNTSLALNYFDTAFGVDADNYVIYRQYAENNDSGLLLSEKTIYIDCESMDAYAYDITGDGYYNHNKAAIFNGQITIPPGRSVLRISNLRADFDHVDKITLIPRWWVL